MPLKKIISGGQTGADLGAWRAAKRCGLTTGGWMPKGFRTEAGPRPEFAKLYGAVEHESPEYPPRNLSNARDCHAAIWIGDTESPGFRSTMDACNVFPRFVYVVKEGVTRPSDVAAWLDASPNIEVLYVAGNRESRAPGIGERSERFLVMVFARMGFREAQPSQ